MKKALFIDRDGTVIAEPPADYQVDSLEKLEFIPGAISALRTLRGLDFELVMATNQDGLGTEAFPEEDFRPPHEKMLRTLAGDAGKVVYKPNCKGQGTGVRILPAATEAEQADALAYLRANSGGIVEEYIQQHPTLAQLNPGAVSIVRFYTVTAPSGTYLFAPVLTTAIEKDISNGCQDALTAMIDIRTGVVITDAVDQNNFIDYHTHPVTGVPFPGLQLPFWAETIDMMRRAVPLASKISNIGWDVTMTADGPLIIEANTIPGFNTAQYRGYAWVTDGYGYQPLFDELNGRPFVNNEHYTRVLLKLD